MAETLPSEVPSDQQPAEVIELDAYRPHDTAGEQLNPADISDQEAVQFFFSEVLHPSNQRKVGIVVQRMIGDRDSDGLTEIDQQWRKRMSEIMIDADDLDDESLDADTPLRTIDATLRSTRERARDLVDERRALRVLRDLRAGVTTREGLDRVRDDARWGELIRKLGGSALT